MSVKAGTYYRFFGVGKFLRFCSVMLVAALLGWAQAPNLNPGHEGDPVPVVIFDYNWGSAQPSHYSIAVESTGNAAYRSEELPQKGQMAGDPYVLKFVVTQPTRSKIFELAKEANYFEGNFDFTKSRIANTGAKTLTFLEGHLPNDFDRPTKGRKNQTTYNWSEDPAIQQLNQIFQSMSASFELGRRLDFKRRFDKLGLEAELKRAEEMQKSGDLQQLQAISPVLKNIVNDAGVMHIARQRAQRLLNAANTASQ